MAPASAEASSSKLKGKRKMLEDSESDSDDGGAALESGFKVNEEYAKRFEHNKKREEKQRLEEKAKKGIVDDDESDESSSEDETEDEEGFLATEDLDAQISATLNAIRSKDPRVYDKDITFYQGEDADGNVVQKKKEAKPVTLRDYQREKLLKGDMGGSDDEEAPRTYLQEQADLQKSIVSEINNAAAESDDDSDEDAFMKRKEPKQKESTGVHPSRAAKIKIQSLDVESADKDPENFLSNFMAARAWVGADGGNGKWQAFDSDDSEEEEKADQFEEAYNLRFEDPSKSNEVLKSYSRDLTASRSVRREEKTGRKKQRELEREKKEAAKQERKEEKARLRKLKLDETAEKLRKIKQAAGKSGKEVTDEEWMRFLNDAWEDDKWEEEMSKRFGDEYYAQKEAGASSDEDEDDDEDDDDEETGGKKLPEKPTWDDDIDIKDIVPDFEDDTAKPTISLSDIEDTAEQDEAEEEDDDEENGPPTKKRKADHKKTRIETQRKTRQERAKLEALVDSRLELTNHPLLSSNKATTSSTADAQNPTSLPTFRYRETSPQSFGMTARDILLAPSDAALNEFAGLKKLATFRDDEKKRRDRKRLGKKARLREWRRGVFGKEFEREGPTYGFEKFVDEDEMKGLKGGDGGAAGDVAVGAAGADGEEKKKKKRKRSKGKKKAAEDEMEVDDE